MKAAQTHRSSQVWQAGLTRWELDFLLSETPVLGEL